MSITLLHILVAVSSHTSVQTLLYWPLRYFLKLEVREVSVNIFLETRICKQLCGFCVLSCL